MMEDNSKITFLVKSSSGKKPYEVDFMFKDSQMFIFCSCPAGKYGNFCKHKINLLQGDFNILDDGNECNELETIGELLQRSDFINLILERVSFKQEVIEAQSKLDAIKHKLRKVEKKMAQEMKNGVKIRI